MIIRIYLDNYVIGTITGFIRDPYKTFIQVLTVDINFTYADTLSDIITTISPTKSVIREVSI